MCAKFGILPNGGGEAFQAASKVSCVVFDKTGTLTRGETEITDFEISTGESVIWTLVAALEKGSVHPLASALMTISRKNQLVPARVANFEEIPGKGVRGVVLPEGDSAQYLVIIGNQLWMEENDVSLPPLVDRRLECWKKEAKSVILLAFQEVVQGKNLEIEMASRDAGKFVLGAIFAAADPIREESLSVVKALQKQHISVWMISGDNHTTAIEVATRVGIPENCVVADVLPHEKVNCDSCLD